jgi:hypothetical protein
MSGANDETSSESIKVLLSSAEIYLEGWYTITQLRGLLLVMEAEEKELASAYIETPLN